MSKKFGVLIVAAGLVLASSGAAIAKETRTTSAQPSAFSLFVSKLLSPNVTTKKKSSTPTATTKATGGCDMNVPAQLRNCDVAPPPPPPPPPSTQPCTGRECPFFDPGEGGDI